MQTTQKKELSDKTIEQVLDKAEVREEARDKSGIWPILFTAFLIISGSVAVLVFPAEMNAFALSLLDQFGENNMDLALFILTAISASPLCLPVWVYTMAGTAMGYDLFHLSLVMALGAGAGSTVTYYLGYRFGQARYLRRKFPKALSHPWIEGRSRRVVTILLLLGTITPIPLDVFYLACGIKKYPPLLFMAMIILGALVKYFYMAYGFSFLGGWS